MTVGFRGPTWAPRKAIRARRPCCARRDIEVVVALKTCRCGRNRSTPRPGPAESRVGRRVHADWQRTRCCRAPNRPHRAPARRAPRPSAARCQRRTGCRRWSSARRPRCGHISRPETRSRSAAGWTVGPGGAVLSQVADATAEDGLAALDAATAQASCRDHGKILRRVYGKLSECRDELALPITLERAEAPVRSPTPPSSSAGSPARRGGRVEPARRRPDRSGRRRDRRTGFGRFGQHQPIG